MRDILPAAIVVVLLLGLLFLLALITDNMEVL